MVILLLLLWSLCAVYITRFLYKRNMKVAAGLYVVLYLYLTTWIFLISGWDFVQFGFVPDRYAELYAGDFYHSFTRLIEVFDKLPSGILIAIVGLCIALATSVIAFLVIGGVHLAKAIAKVLQGKPLSTKKGLHTVHTCVRALPVRSRIYLEYCRLNN